MPATSVAQRRAIAIAEKDPAKLYKRNSSLKEMTHQQMHDFAATKEKGLPQHTGVRGMLHHMKRAGKLTSAAKGA